MSQSLTFTQLNVDVIGLFFAHSNPRSRKNLGTACKKLCNIFRSRIDTLHLPEHLSQQYLDLFFERACPKVKWITTPLDWPPSLLVYLLGQKQVQRIESLRIPGIGASPEEELALGNALVKLTSLRTLDILVQTIGSSNIKGLRGTCISETLSIASLIICDRGETIKTLTLPPTVRFVDVSKCWGLTTITPLTHVQLAIGFLHIPGFHHQYSDLVAQEMTHNSILAQDLLDKGLDPNIILEYAIVHSIFELASFGLQRRADPNYIDWFGDTLLVRACNGHGVECVELLVKNGANPNLQACLFKGWINRQGPRTLRIAALLLENGADPNRINFPFDCKNVKYSRPLHRAVHSNYTEMVALLLQHGAKSNLPRRDGKTPFYLACYPGPFKQCNAEIITLLLQHGADLQSVNGKALLIWARARGHQELEVLLRQKGVLSIGIGDYPRIALSWMREHLFFLLFFTASACIVFLVKRKLSILKKS
ncbi:MAG TPA: ankyrin repeat domain-containing protein [Rhabdochlamydiaceae bacterium]|jgi:hypothetical protein|nr:ankyrin repeat domain-containing protein [Rhabdochlamydiaceae bacterium]